MARTRSAWLWPCCSGTGIVLNIGNLVNLVGWQIGLFALVAAGWRRMRGFSALCLPVAAISVPFIGAASASAASSPASWQIGSHVVLSVLAYALMNIAAILALFMVVQERAIKSRHPGWLASLMPPLEVLEQSLFVCIGLGFFLLSLAIFSGLIFVEDLFAQHLVHKTVLSMLGWLIFGTLLLGRWRFGWRGKTAAAWTLGGFAALLLAYFGSRIVLEFILGRPWGGQ